MEQFFSMSLRSRRGNLHVRLEGVMDSSAALRLARLLSAERSQYQRLFVDTAHIHGIAHNASVVFQEELKKENVPLSQVFFKGKKGLELAPTGCRVLISPETRCSSCAHCARHTRCAV